MAIRQNPLSKFESFMQRIVESPFAFLFPSQLQPSQVRRKLELAMEDNLVLQGDGRRLAPNLYTIFLSSKDYQQLSQSISYHTQDWQNHLVEVARQRHYMLKTIPFLRLAEDTDLRVGRIRIEAALADRQHVQPNANDNSGINLEGGMMATKALSPEELAQLRAQLAGAQQSGVHDMDSFSPGQSAAPMPSYNSNPDYPGNPSYPGYSGNPPSSLMPPVPPQPAPINMPRAALSISLPQAGEQTYRIEKPVVKIGRQLNNDIIVEDKRVSRYHAQIKFQPDGQFALFDLGSTNGITINGTPNQRHHILRNGDCFTIGSYDFYFKRM